MPRWQRWRTHLALFAMVVGPGLITANVDNDAGGIATYSVAGAKYGYALLWVLIPTCFLLVLVQEMSNRMGVVTGKGLSALIRERFGLGPSFYLMIALIFTNLGNAIADFAGVAASARIFGLPPFLVVPAGAFVLWHIVIKGTYRTIERAFFVACLFYVTYIISGILAKPDWSEAARGTLMPQMHWEEWDAGRLYMIVGIVGTTIAPWMQFYQQASVVEKGIPIKHYFYSRLDTIFGALIVTLVCFFIVVACAATLHKEGIAIETADQAAQALGPIAGDYCKGLFALGLLMAGFFGAAILPISTATTVCEAMGWESGVQKRFIEAPHYYVIYTLIIVIGASVALAASSETLIPIMLFSQVVNGVLLPVVVYLMLRITNDRSIMGEHVNSRAFNIFAWAGTAIISTMSIAMVVMAVWPKFFPSAA